MSKHILTHGDSDVDSPGESSTASHSKKRRISAGDGINIQPDSDEDEPGCQSPCFEDEEGSSVDREETPGLFLGTKQNETAEQNISHNKNPAFWCNFSSPAEQSSSAYIWDGSPHKFTFDHSVDDPMLWGPYLSERQWGTVREDYSENENNWEHVSYEDACGHAYVSGEDGLLGVSDKCQLLCAAPALWNGKDRILKERLFGLTGIEGNHGEDVKELYYYLDNLPDHSYMRGLYKYPQCAFPYQQLRDENRHRSFDMPEFELTDTGIFEEGGHWDVTVEYIKTDHLGLACMIEAVNNGKHKETIHIIPQFWFRHVQKNEPIPKMADNEKPKMTMSEDGSVKIKYSFGIWHLLFLHEQLNTEPKILFTNNISCPAAETCDEDDITYGKDAFHKYIIFGNKSAIKPRQEGSKCGAHYQLTAEAGAKVQVYWRIESHHYRVNLTLMDLKNLFAKKRKDAQNYYNSMMPDWTHEERNIGIQAMAGLFWSKQYYMFDVKNWLEDFRRCRANRGRKGRNSDWSHVHNHHILLMPDNWEFPWYAGWDLCISAVLYARYSIPFAKTQLTTFLSDCYMHPNGQLPGCEFELSDVNPPLQPWAVLKIHRMDGSTDHSFLRKCFHRLLFNYTWWMNKEFESTSTYGRGFLGMDNISVIDRSGYLPFGWHLVQADCTGWMACLALWMLQIVVELSQVDKFYKDLIPRFLSQFFRIASAMNKTIQDEGLWDEEDGFFYDVFITPHGRIPIRVRSMVGLVPLLACGKIKLKKFPMAASHFEHVMTDYPDHVWRLKNGEVVLSAMSLARVQRVLQRVFSEDEFLSHYGIRSLSKVYEGHPYHQMVGDQHFHLKYTPGESDSGAFGGNSNWRGPIWVFMNYLLLESFDMYVDSARRRGSNVHVKQADSKHTANLTTLTKNLEKRLLAMYLPDKDGHRPLHGTVKRYATDPKWKNLILFYEYSHADTGRGCGASHQTGWTAAITEIIYRIHKR